MARRSTILLAASLLIAAACGDDTDDTPPDAAADVGDAADDADAGADSDADPDPATDVPEPDADANADADPDADPDASDDAGDAEDAEDADAGRPADEPLPDDWDPSSGELPANLIPDDDEFLVVVLPDTQIYAQSFPETFDAQLKWIADHAEAYRIVFVSHVGDIVQNGHVGSQWDAAVAAYDWILDIDLPHGFSIGGHDISFGGSTARDYDASCSTFDHLDCGALDFLERFGPDKYAEADWYGGASPSGRSNYQRITVDGLPLLFMHVPQDAPEAEVVWASEVLDANPGVLAHLTTHRYLYDYRLTEDLPAPLNILPAGRFDARTYTLGGQSQMFQTSVSANDLFRRLVYDHPNVWGVHCGHVDAEFWQTSTNSAGLPVYEVLVDYQDMSDGGGGWMRLLKFSPNDNEVTAFTYSATSGEIRADGDGFDHSVGILESYRHEADEFLNAFGLSDEEVDGLLEDIKTPGPLRDMYYDSLYAEGARDSRWVMSVDFQAYIDATE